MKKGECEVEFIKNKDTHDQMKCRTPAVRAASTSVLPCAVSCASFRSSQSAIILEMMSEDKRDRVS